ncbi:MAG: hypothetical protein V7726_03815 [Pseudoalteromonas distincta]|uniref:hypothetical protein n=1 Tax=Pseudoalteromonas distincta TaxID=77608 RepID=UPI003001CEEE
MKLHPRAKVALKYYNAHRKERDVGKCDFSQAAWALFILKDYAPEIAKRIEASCRPPRACWFLYLGAEFSIQIETYPQSFFDAYYQRGRENPNEDIAEFLNDIPF